MLCPHVAFWAQHSARPPLFGSSVPERFFVNDYSPAEVEWVKDMMRLGQCFQNLQTRVFHFR